MQKNFVRILSLLLAFSALKNAVADRGSNGGYQRLLLQSPSNNFAPVSQVEVPMSASSDIDDQNHSTAVSIDINTDIDADSILDDIKKGWHWFTDHIKYELDRLGEEIGHIVENIEGVTKAEMDEITELLNKLPEKIKNEFHHIEENLDKIPIKWDAIENSKTMTSLSNVLKPIWTHLQPIFDFIGKHPWVLIPLLIPAFQVLLFIIGFTTNGIAGGSIAALIQSKYPNIPKNSLFAFFQSNGAKGIANSVFTMAGMWVFIAVLLVLIVYLLVDSGVIDSGKVQTTVESVWDGVVAKFDGDKGSNAAGVMVMGDEWANGVLWKLVGVNVICLLMEGYRG